MQRPRVLLTVGFASVGMIWAGAVSGSMPDKLSSYAYEDTRRLVAFVEDAARFVEEKGESAFSEFGREGSKWFSDPYYLFVYEPDGTCVFHPLQPDWVGKNMSELRDMNSKPMVQLIAQVGERPQRDASDWIFYLWPDKTQLIPQWKSAYIRKVVTPSGKTYVIGSGVYDIKMERAFVEERVRRACESRHPVQQILEKLRNADDAWVQYLWPKPGSSLPSRKLVYVRKAHAGDETFIVGSDFFLATPIWMRD